MKKLFSLIFIIFLYIFNPAYSEQKIAFINMNKVLSESNPGSSILKQLTNINKKNLVILKKEEEKFKKKESELISQKNIISENDYKSKISDLKNKIDIYNQNRNKMIKDFNKLKLDNTNNLLKLINPILVKFSNDKEISIILQKKNLVVAKNELDITDEIIEIINIEIKEYKIK